mgnify:CR=1
YDEKTYEKIYSARGKCGAGNFVSRITNDASELNAR